MYPWLVRMPWILFYLRRSRNSLFCSLSQTGCFSPPTVYDKMDYIHIIVIPLTQIINIFSSHKLKLALLFDLTSMAQDRRVRTRRQH